MLLNCSPCVFTPMLNKHPYLKVFSVFGSSWKCQLAQRALTPVSVEAPRNASPSLDFSLAFGQAALSD